jgi:hypothetical protein
VERGTFAVLFAFPAEVGDSWHLYAWMDSFAILWFCHMLSSLYFLTENFWLFQM